MVRYHKMDTDGFVFGRPDQVEIDVVIQNGELADDLKIETFTSAYDVKFGMEVGAGAVLLLARGISGVTVTGVTCGKVSYMKTEEAIKQRNVDLREVALYEQLGLCFGREPAPFEPAFEEVSGMIPRIYQ